MLIIKLENMLIDVAYNIFAISPTHSDDDMGGLSLATSNWTIDITCSEVCG